ncbi:MAG: hypothetical protein EOO43_25015, partial [Flavobacterium sp.]
MMRTIQQLLITWLLFCSIRVFCQENSSNIIFEQHKDLNNDKIEDEVLVTKTLNNKSSYPYLLQVFFKDANNNKTLIASTSKAIFQLYSNGKPLNLYTDCAVLV